jgi:hypothetical protein
MHDTEVPGVLDQAEDVLQWKCDRTSPETRLLFTQVFLLRHRHSMRTGRPDGNALDALIDFGASTGNRFAQQQVALERGAHTAKKNPERAGCLLEEALGLRLRDTTAPQFKEIPGSRRLGLLRACVEVLADMGNRYDAAPLAVMYARTAAEVRSSFHLGVYERWQQRLGLPRLRVRSADEILIPTFFFPYYSFIGELSPLKPKGENLQGQGQGDF